VRIGLARIELDTISEAAIRLNRIGADWEFVSPAAPLETLRMFDVVYFSSGWGKLDGLSELAVTYRRFLEQGGGLVFAQPDTDGDRTSRPALQLLPFPVTVSAYARNSVAASVVNYLPDRPHPLTDGVAANDLPFPYDVFPECDERWHVLAKSTGQDRQRRRIFFE